MAKWIHRIENGKCAHCGDVTLVRASGRWACPNSASVVNRHKGSNPPQGSRRRALRIDELGREYDGTCEICGQATEEFKVDHDHVTGKARGYLCHHCNVGLGWFKDSPESLMAAINYLERTNG